MSDCFFRTAGNVCLSLEQPANCSRLCRRGGNRHERSEAADDLGGAEGVDAVHQCDADADFGGLSVGVPGGDPLSEGLEATHLRFDPVAGVTSIPSVALAGSMSTRRVSGPSARRYRFWTARVFWRRHRVAKSGAGQSRPARHSRLATIPAVCMSGSLNRTLIDRQNRIAASGNAAG